MVYHISPLDLSKPAKGYENVPVQELVNILKRKLFCLLLFILSSKLNRLTQFSKRINFFVKYASDTENKKNDISIKCLQQQLTYKLQSCVKHKA